MTARVTASPPTEGFRARGSSLSPSLSSPTSTALSLNLHHRGNASNASSSLPSARQCDGSAYFSDSSAQRVSTAPAHTRRPLSRPLLKDSVRQWFSGLSLEERERTLCIEDKAVMTVLRKMSERKAQDGEGLFFNVDDLSPGAQPASAGRHDPFVCHRKLSLIGNLCFYPDALLQADRRVEESIRMCDTREYLDTITLDNELFRESAQFFSLMTVVTRGGFLNVECRVAWDTASKTWTWEKPKWFVGMGFYSLGTFIAHKLEQALWMRYWEAHSIDPRVPVRPYGKPRTYTYPKYAYPKYHKGLLTKAYLIEFWQSTAPQDRKKIVGSIGAIVAYVLKYKDVADVAVTEPEDEELDYRSMLTTLVELSAQEKNLEPLFSTTSNQARTFIEILYFSPLKRAGSTIDMILRRIGMCIQKAYTEKLSMDLIMGEEAEKLTKEAESQKKKKAKKKKKAPPAKPKTEERKERASSISSVSSTPSSGKAKRKNSKQSLSSSPALPVASPAVLDQSADGDVDESVDGDASSMMDYCTQFDCCDAFSAPVVAADDDANGDEFGFAPVQVETTCHLAPPDDDHDELFQVDPVAVDEEPLAEPGPAAPSASKESVRKTKKVKKKKKKASPAKTSVLPVSAATVTLASTTSTLTTAAAAAADPSKGSKSMLEQCAPILSPVSAVSGQQLEMLRRRAFAVRLHEEITEYCEFVRSFVNSKLTPKVESMTRRVQTLVRLLWPSACVETFGSMATHLCIASSDLDLVVIGAYTTEQGSPFEVLARELKKQPWLHQPSFQPIPTAKIPVIKLISTLEKIQTDITFCGVASVAELHAPAPTSRSLRSSSSSVSFDTKGSEASHKGLRACDLVKSYIRQFHPLAPLVLVLKQFLFERGLSNAYGGGLSSYCLVLMVVSFLQTHASKEADRPNKKNLGDLLLRFLHLYGITFEYTRTGIDVLDGGRHFPLTDKWLQCGSAPPIVLVDPFNPSNNIAYSAFAMHRAKAAFHAAYATLEAAYVESVDGSGGGPVLSRVLLMWDAAQRGRLHHPNELPLGSPYMQT